MRCINCTKLSFRLICKECFEVLKTTTPTSTQIDGLRVYSFYGYSEISRLIFSKHQIYGARVYKELAKLTFAKFEDIHKFTTKVNAIGLDDHTRSGYSHTAILANSLKSTNIEPMFRVLRAKSHLTYHGKTLEFRSKNPRNFEVLKLPLYPVILVDDIITTGQSMRQARDALKEKGVDVLFGLTLASAKF